MAQGKNGRRMLARCLAVGALAAITLLPLAAGAQDKAQTMVVEFAIKDYASWRPVFDGAEAARAKLGVTNPRVFRHADKPERLLVLFDTASIEQGQAWMTSATVKADWEKGGVVGVPTFRFLR